MGGKEAQECNGGLNSMPYLADHAHIRLPHYHICTKQRHKMITKIAYTNRRPWRALLVCDGKTIFVVNLRAR